MRMLIARKPTIKLKKGKIKFLFSKTEIENTAKLVYRDRP